MERSALAAGRRQEKGRLRGLVPETEPVLLYGVTVTVIVPLYAPAGAFSNPACAMEPTTFRVLPCAAPMPVPAPPLVLLIEATMIAAPLLIDAVAGTTKTGEVPFEQRYVMSALPVAVVAELGSMLAPELAIVTTGAAVKNLHTPLMLAFTVTVTLSAALAAEATIMRALTAAKTLASLETFILILL